MKFHRYWVERMVPLRLPDGSIQESRFFGASDRSQEEAEQDACARAERVGKHIAAGLSGWSYELERPIREEVIEELDADNIISRNRQGSLVLNSTGLAFIDIDYKSGLLAQGWRGFFNLIINRKLPEETRAEMLFEQLSRRLRKSALADHAVRVYRTKAGMRLAVADLGLPAESRQAAALMKHCRADQLYIFMCRKQRSYRARLTPKAYRIGQPARRCDWPRRPEDEEAMRQWSEAYQGKSANYASCRYLDTLGPHRTQWPAALLRHDELCRAGTTLPLA